MIFYSNGYDHWIWDDCDYPPRSVQGFYTHAELELLVQRRSTKKRLAAAELNKDIAGRFYQTRALRRIGEAFERDRERKSLLVMATGSGKTRTTIALVDLLMRCNWVKRVLINLIINHLTDHGAMDAALLYESPFTDITPTGPESLFTAAQVERSIPAAERSRSAPPRSWSRFWRASLRRRWRGTHAKQYARIACAPQRCRDAPTKRDYWRGSLGASTGLELYCIKTLSDRDAFQHKRILDVEWYGGRGLDFAGAHVARSPIIARISAMWHWTIRSILKAMLAASWQRPLVFIVAVVVVPALWLIPATVVQAKLIPANAPIFGPGRTMHAIAVSWAFSAWSTVSFPGQLLAAIAIVTGRSFRWWAFFTNLSKVPALFLSGIIAILPLELLDLLPVTRDGTVSQVTTVVAVMLAVFLMARTSLCAPLLVDSHHSLWSCLAISWVSTRGHSLRLVGLALLLGALVLPVFIIELLLSAKLMHATAGTLGAFYALAVAQLYVSAKLSTEGSPAVPTRISDNATT